MKKLLFIVVVLVMLISLPVSALDLGKLTLTVQPVDYVSALAGIARPVSKAYAANERYAVAVTVNVPQYYDVTNMQVVAEPANCTVETGDIRLITGTYLVTGTVLAPGASLTITFRDNALYTASSAQDLYQALQNDRTVSAAAALGQAAYTAPETEQPGAGGTPSMEIPKTGDRAGLAGVLLIIAGGALLYGLFQKKAGEKRV